MSELNWDDAYDNADYSQEGYSIFKWGGSWSAYRPGIRAGSNDRINNIGYDTRTEAKQACQDHHNLTSFTDAERDAVRERVID
jgi:hypothetical protein